MDKKELKEQELEALNKSNEAEPDVDEKNLTLREKWTRNIDFLLSLVGFSVGLGNVWRFPYLCYKNGGGAFLVPYFISAALIGVPLFFLEVSLGQYTSQGGISAWNICPLFKGMGYGSVTVMGITNIYYNVIIAWAFHYLFASFTTQLPWSHCNNTWNTDSCITSIDDVIGGRNTSTAGGVNGTEAYEYIMVNDTKVNISDLMQNYTNPATEYWSRRVLQVSSGIDDVGVVRWDLGLCLLLAWIVVYLCIWKGIKSSGKVMYFTATSPYVFMIVLLIRGATLPGAIEGIKFYIIPKWSSLLKPQVWVDAGTQIVYTYSIGQGTLTALGSFNKFNHNSYRDTLLFVIVNSLTSILAGFVIFAILGFMAVQQGVSVADVAESGPGLAFIAYPQAVAKMPLAPLWSALFFIMIILLGLDSQFVGVEGFVTGVVDEMPHLIRRKNRKEIFILVVCIISFLIGLTMVTNGGIYVLQLIDFYNVRTYCVNLFISCIVVAYIYGVNRFYDNITEMLGYRISPFMKICWLGITPLLILILFAVTIYSYTDITYNRTYHYPMWSIIIGWMMGCIPVIAILTVMVVSLARARGTIKNRFRTLLWPETNATPSKEVQQNGKVVI